MKIKNFLIILLINFIILLTSCNFVFSIEISGGTNSQIGSSNVETDVQNRKLWCGNKFTKPEMLKVL